MLADLHIHTTCSDGIYTPEQIVDKALELHLVAIAITDHDNVDGYLVAQDYINKYHLPLTLVPAIEIDTETVEHRPVHVLGYHIDVTNQQLLKGAKWVREGRVVRITKMVHKLQQLGYKITMEEVQQEAAGSKSLGRPHIARILVRKGYFDVAQAVFDALIASGRPAYCRQEKFTPTEAVRLIHAAQGIAVMAHPTEIENTNVASRELDAAGFDGLEVWHPSTIEAHSLEFWYKIALAKGLLMSGGSDFHGNKGRFPEHLGEFPVLYQNVASVVKYHQ